MTPTRSRAAKVTLPTDDQILITREFDAPRHLVYQAWTTPELVKRWWSGQRGEVTIAEIDLPESPKGCQALASTGTGPGTPHASLKRSRTHRASPGTHSHSESEAWRTRAQPRR